MRLRLKNVKIEGLSTPIKMAEKVDIWFWYFILITLFGYLGWIGFKLFQIHQIYLWIESIAI